MVDKDFCLSSYLAFRYVYDDRKDFFPGLKHKLIQPLPEKDRIFVTSVSEIDREIKRQVDELYQKHHQIGILLSGGMDSAILATYLKPGSNAYTFTTDLSDDVYDADFTRAKTYCQKLGLKHHSININFDDYQTFAPLVMARKCAPVHSIEPQIYKAAIKAKANGDELILVGESADLIFGGMDQLLAKDWDFDEFVARYTFLDPALVLKAPVDMGQLFEKYRLPGNKIDFLKFMDEVFSIESSSSYENAFAVAEMPYFDPYARLKMSEPLDLARVRSGEPKYLVRGLFKLRYPDLPVPNKIPMPRPVDKIFSDYPGPESPEFLANIPLERLTGNQKWQLWCADQFLKLHGQGNVNLPS